jgi:hypothetical protein
MSSKQFPEIGKILATQLIQEAGLEGLPARVVFDRAGLAATLASLGGAKATFVVRAASATEERNLPRAINLSAPSVLVWAQENVRASYAVIVQPFAPLVFSAEILIGSGGILCEVVPGMWELDNQFPPTVLHFYRSGVLREDVALEAHGNLMRARWHVEGIAMVEKCRVDDWMCAVLADWMEERAHRLEQLFERIGRYGLKVHYAEGYGISPQNIRTRVPEDPSTFADTRVPDATLAVTTTAATIPEGTSAVVVRLGVAREDATAIEALAQRLVLAGVKVAFLESGMLSHLAIALREAGLITRRAAAASV